MSARLKVLLSGLAASLIAGVLAFPAAAAFAEETVSGTIKRYECGDNCYLTITSRGKELTGLCVAAECNSWNRDAAMPADMIGSNVTVSVSMRQQYDAAGNARGNFPAFTEILYGN